MQNMLLHRHVCIVFRAVTKTLIGGGGEYSYIRVLPDEFFWNQLSLQLISKEIRRAEREYMNMRHPPINALVTALIVF